MLDRTTMTSVSPTPPDEHMTATARRNLLLLTCCQAVGQACNTMMFAATGLSVITFYHRHDLANLPVTMQHIGVMLWVFPAALLMQRVGRSIGFRVGSLFGMLGGSVVALGLYLGSLVIMCLGGVILGYAVSCLQMYRFAAAELVPLRFRAQAISWVTAGGVAAAVIGPTMVRWSHDLWMPLYIGTYATLVAFHVVVFTIMSFIKFPDLKNDTPSEEAPATDARPLLEIASQPRFMASALSGMIAFGTMSFIMSASPLAIVGCGLPHAEAHWVILLHVLGMFVPSFFTGNLINRFGVTNVMAIGVALMLAGVGIALTGVTEWHFRIALTSNGIGWNFLFIGATTLLTSCYRPSERGKTQAFNDFLVFGTTAISSFMAGYLQEHWGWFPLNTFSIALLAIAVFAVFWLRMQDRRSAAPV
jgi:MFS family permease